jgi:LysM repeat protein
MANPFDGLDLGKQVGPLPAGAWIALVGGGLGVAMYLRNRNRSSDIVYADDTSSIPGVGVGGVGAYTPTDGGTSPDTTPVGIQSNAQWQQAAFTYLVATGADASFVDKTLRDYLQGVGLNLQGNALVSLALAKLGLPPEPLPDAPALPVRPVTPTPTPARPAPVRTPVKPPAKVTPKRVAKPQPRTYIVLPGDSLWKIAARYYGAGAQWPSIYNANRSVIGGNPNVIHTGMRLIIPAH